MANAITNIITANGANIIAYALTETVTFTSVVVGSGCFTGSDINTQAKTNGKMYWEVNGATYKIGEASIKSTSVKNGVFTITVSWQNTNYTGAVTKINEIGIYAKTSSSVTTPVLFGYLSLGDYGSTIAPKSTQTITRVYDIPYSFGGDTSTLEIIPSGYVSNDSTSTTKAANKLIYTNGSGKIDADITGDAHTIDGHLYTAFALTEHDHSNATSSNNGFMSSTDKAKLDELAGQINQSLTKTSTPTFGGLTVNGYIDGAMFR